MKVSERTKGDIFLFTLVILWLVYWIAIAPWPFKRSVLTPDFCCFGDPHLDGVPEGQPATR